MPEMSFDWDGLIGLLAKHLYSEKRIFIRELIQNAHDAIIKRRGMEPGFGGRLDIESDPERGVVVFKDDGIGMSDSDLIEFLSTVGKGDTQTVKSQYDGLIGQFGIGFLSAFVVASKVEVHTRKIGESSGWIWTNTGSRSYEIRKSGRETTGTSVTVYIPQSEIALIADLEIKEVIKTYADMLSVPIFVNGSSRPVNSMRMPWEEDYGSKERAEVESRVFLESRMSDSVLEVIPIEHLKTINADGVLYISRSRVLGLPPPRNVEVFLSRMLVNRKLPEILPDWASFVNGVINSSELQPTAARDNIMRDAKFDLLKIELGKLIIRHLERLRDEDLDRFSRILEYHSIRIKASCLAYDEFFDNFAHLVQWRVNSNETDRYTGAIKPRMMSITEILNETVRASGPDERRRVYCFSEGNSDHFFRMANAAGIIVVEANAIYEIGLLRRLAEVRDLRLVQVDREDAEVLFREPTGDELVANLAKAMSAYLDVGGTRVEVIGRAFEPASLPAIVRAGEGIEEREIAERLYNDPQQSRDTRELAEAMIKRPPKSIKLTINASNSLVKRLAAQDLDDRDVRQLMLGLYNSGFLASGTLTEHNAKILSNDFLFLMDRTLDFIQSREELQKRVRQLEEAKRKVDGEAPKSLRHKIFFMMTPYRPYYESLIFAVRNVVEELWQCQLFLGSERKYDDRILDSVREHMTIADAFIAELTEANPNVMFELGAAFADRRNRPIIQLFNSSKAKETGASDLPVDLRSMIYVEYGQFGDKQLEDDLDKEFQKDVRISALLRESSREHYVSPRKLSEYLRGFVSQSVCRSLADGLPTREAWKSASLEQVESLLGDDPKEFASAILARVIKALS